MSGKILVLGDFRQTVTVVRSLARAGFQVTLGCDDPRSSTAMSRYVSDLWIYDWSSSERFYDHLEAYLRSEQPEKTRPVHRRVREAAEKQSQRGETGTTKQEPPLADIAMNATSRRIRSTYRSGYEPSRPHNPRLQGKKSHLAVPTAAVRTKVGAG